MTSDVLLYKELGIMIEDAWNDFTYTKLEVDPVTEDFSGLQLITIRHDGSGLYRNLRSGGYVICSPDLKKEISESFL